ncbi:MAG: sensor histidine kinase, partial [Planctomycetales bacterium]|nr:sensor histidine kinase [Planctomycetales bacterium]
MQASAADSRDAVEQQMAQLKQDLLDAQRMAALGELASTTAHEFNNLLTTILNYAKMGLRHKDEATRTRALEKILAAGTRAEKVTNSVLGMARNRGTSPAPTRLGDLVGETMVLLEREMAKHRIQVEVEIMTDRRALVVGSQIQQVLM